MADTALTGKEAKEYFDSPEKLSEKLDQLAAWIRESAHFVAFTGAGISTAAGIPDFRSGLDTKLPVGAGAWTLRAAKTDRSRKQSKATTSTLNAIPTPTHMFLVEMERLGLLKHLTSQNTDGLHMRSGFNPATLAELHGNSNLEICSGRGGCGKRYLRDYRTRRSGVRVHDHGTGRLCSCGKELRDSIINFGEDLPSRDITMAFEEHNKADVCLVMGSSLRVTPAADAPAECAANGGKLVIVNLQKTPLDSSAALVIRAFCDDVSRGVADRLGVTIPKFALKRRVRVSLAAKPAAGAASARATSASSSTSGLPGAVLELCGLGLDDTPFALLADGSASVLSASGAVMASTLAVRLVAASTKAGAGGKTSASKRVPAALRIGLPTAAQPAGSVIEAVCTFVGHYREPPIRVVVPLDSLAGLATVPRILDLSLVPGTAAWEGDDLKTAPKRAEASVTGAAAASGSSASARTAKPGKPARLAATARIAKARTGPGPRRGGPVAAVPAAAQRPAAAGRGGRAAPGVAATALTHEAMLAAHRSVASLTADFKALEIN